MRKKNSRISFDFGLETILMSSTYKSSEASVTFGMQGIPLDPRREPTISQQHSIAFFESSSKLRSLVKNPWRSHRSAISDKPRRYRVKNEIATVSYTYIGMYQRGAFLLFLRAYRVEGKRGWANESVYLDISSWRTLISPRGISPLEAATALSGLFRWD